MATSVYTGIIEREGDMYVALCPELDVASQGKRGTSDWVRGLSAVMAKSIPNVPCDIQERAS